MAQSIFEVMEYGPIVFSDEETGVLITVNGSYFNWWYRRGRRSDGTPTWENTECRATGLDRGLYEPSATLKSLMDRAEQWFQEVMSEAAAEA